MADKIFPWTELVPEVENPDDYRWQAIDTEITEGDDVVSFCDVGSFRVLARVRVHLSSQLSPEK